MRREKDTDGHGIFQNGPDDSEVLQRARMERVNEGSVDPSADDIPDGLVRSQVHG